MPMPVSVTLNSIHPSRASALTVTLPRSVNFTALAIRFLSNTLSFTVSLYRRGRSGATRQIDSTPGFSSRVWVSAWISRRSAAGSMSCKLSAARPVSRRLMSSVALMSSTSSRALVPDPVETRRLFG